MKSSLLLLFLVGSLVACSHTPVETPVQEDWKIQPATADQKLSLDEQFLRKSQDSTEVTARKDKKTFLHP